jgi:hypothetical protein
MRSQEMIGNVNSAGKFNRFLIYCSLKSEAVKEKREQIRVQIAERERKI